MNEFLDSEFIKTIVAVLIGGIISFASVFTIDIRNRKKELRERKRKIYSTLIANINLLRRYEQNYAQHDVHFNYHRRIYELDNNDTLSRQQAEYHQIKRDESQLKIVEKAEIIDANSIDFQIYFGESEKFDKLIMEINYWERPESSDYRNISKISDLNNEHDENFIRVTNYITSHMTTALGDLAEYMKKKLK